MNKLFTTLVTLAALSIMIPAGMADTCTPSTSAATVTTPATGVDETSGGPSSSSGIYYFVNDACQPDCVFSDWLYQETNGIDGLQRGDEVVDDTCGGLISPDTDIF